jgi:hypothetical protein
MSARKLMLTCLIWTGALCALLPAVAGAYATVAPAPHQSSATGLPDGRVYELVSPANKHGFPAGGLGFGSEGYVSRYSLAAADGNAVAFGSQGPAAEVDSSGLSGEFVAQRSVSGWRSRSAMPREFNGIKNGGIGQNEHWWYFSSDLSHFVYDVDRPNVPGAPNNSAGNLYLEGPDPFLEPVWLARPVGVEVEFGNYPLSVLGGSPDLSTVYFNYDQEQPLIPGINPGGWALYEYRNGVLSYAGKLPDGSIDPDGAKGIAFTVGNGGVYGPAANGNQVSRDGSRLFFTSSSPEELYVHETEADGTQRTVLASQSQLPGHVGEPAPSGVGAMAATAPGPKELKTTDRHPYGINFQTYESRFTPLFGYASPDGSHVFFKSNDRLTVEAPEGGGTYDFDVDTGVLAYVATPGLAGIVTVADDGSSFVFENNAVSPTELDHWSAGPHGGTVSKIVQLPPLTDPYGEEWCDGVSCVGPAHLVDNNSVLVFAAEAPIPGFNDAGEFMQIFRYDFTTNELSCLSCPPSGIKPSGTPELSSVDEWRNGKFDGNVVADNRGVSTDGSRVFFDSSDPLVPGAVNGERNVYEWENGSLFLISSGTSSSNSLLLDTSESGGDVFFTTTDELVQGDNDMAYDVYDARVPRPGDNPPPASLPCQGDVCQGPPSTPSLLGLPASATFNGLGNAPPPLVSEPAVSKAKTKVKKKSSKHRKRTRTKTGRHALRANHGRGK